MTGELPEILPPGRLVGGADGAVLFWVSEGPWDVGLHRVLLKAHGRTGWWPIVAEGLEGEPDRPWLSAEQWPVSVGEIGAYEAGAVMRGIWSDWVTPEEDEEELDYDFGDLAPYGESCPGLAPAGELMGAPEMVADWYLGQLAPAKNRRLLLAKVERGADLPAQVGWGGPANHSAPMVQLLALLALLRSWEERFGARLVSLGFDTMELSVAAPPRDRRHAEHVGAEHWAFCPDNIDQGAGTLKKYARSIKGKNSWSFWWD